MCIRDSARLEQDLAALLGCPVEVAIANELADELAGTVPDEAIAL